MLKKKLWLRNILGDLRRIKLIVLWLIGVFSRKEKKYSW